GPHARRAGGCLGEGHGPRSSGSSEAGGDAWEDAPPPGRACRRAASVADQLDHLGLRLAESFGDGAVLVENVLDLVGDDLENLVAIEFEAGWHDRDRVFVGGFLEGTEPGIGLEIAL